MTEIITAKAKNKKFDKKKLKRYWKKVYPEKYVKDLVGAKGKKPA